MHSTRLSADEIREYLARSYTAVDGLWFMKAEEQFGFEKALEIDALVWAVMPKIQARQLKSFLNLDSGLDALWSCYSEKLSLDGFDFQFNQPASSSSPPFPVEPGTEKTEDPSHTPSSSRGEPGTMMEIRIAFCPWHDKLVRSNRSHLAAKIGKRICTVEYSAWANEFGCRFEFGEEGRLCNGGPVCVLKFRER